MLPFCSSTGTRPGTNTNLQAISISTRVSVYEPNASATLLTIIILARYQDQIVDYIFPVMVSAQEFYESACPELLLAQVLARGQPNKGGSLDPLEGASLYKDA